MMEVEDGHLLELAVKLPAAMPLRAPELECRRKVGLRLARRRCVEQTQANEGGRMLCARKRKLEVASIMSAAARVGR